MVLVFAITGILFPLYKIKPGRQHRCSLMNSQNSTSDFRQRKSGAAKDTAPMPTTPPKDLEDGAAAPLSRDDWGSIILLTVLYTLQGIPMGLSGSIPLLLAKKVGYGDQAIFSFCSWPFSLKLLWAPIVDACYFSSVGRRKSWLVPVQLLCGVLMVAGAERIDHWVDGSEEALPDTKSLTVYFFVLYFLMATQDVCNDTPHTHKHCDPRPTRGAALTVQLSVCGARARVHCSRLRLTAGR